MSAAASGSVQPKSAAHQRLRQLDDVIRFFLAGKVVGHKRARLPADWLEPGVAATCGAQGAGEMWAAAALAAAAAAATRAEPA